VILLVALSNELGLAYIHEDVSDELSVLIVAFSNELGLVILREDVGDKRLVIQLVTLAGKIGVALPFEVVSVELGLGMPLMALVISIGCCDIGQVLRREEDIMDVTQHQQESKQEKSEVETKMK
jgi:hypothetical protein